jgi:CelD/BcsL family acetyltransferase involved in cellulose biosynthesis
LIEVNVVTRLGELETLREEWDELWHRCDPRTPFQRPEWIIAWCRHFDCRSIWTPVVRRDGRLIAIAPWLIYQRDARRFIAFLAGGVSDYHDVIVDPSCAPAAFEQLFLCLLHHRARWDVCDFEELAPWAMLRNQPAPHHFAEAWSEDAPCPRLDVPGPTYALSAAVPKGQWGRFAKYRRRAERQGPLALERTSGDGVAGAWGEVFQLHRARWERRGQDGALGDERLQAFHAAAAAALAAVCVSVDRVTLAGRTIAGLYGFVIGRVKYCYLQGIDPAFASLSPGLLLVGLVIEAAQQYGLERIDFLRGDEPYKLAWGTTCAINVRRRMWIGS